MATSPSYGGLSSGKAQQTPTQSQSGDDDGTIVKIAIGVTVPVVLIVILALAGLAYWYYRKKYPVRMIVGRDFAKFSNPAYSRPQSHTHMLVREDADAFFQQTQPTGPHGLNFGLDDEEAQVSYTNKGFEYDSHDVDEEEVEKRFRQQKSYLFKRDEDEDDSDRNEEKLEADMVEGEKAKKKDKSKANGQIQRGQGHENAAFSGDSDNDGTDGEETGKTGETNGKKDKADSDSISSDISGTPNKGEKAVNPENNSLQETAPQMLPDAADPYQPGMTVRDFLRLQLTREKRALSDADRVRADMLTALTFDINKSARRRAQSAGDIWTSAGQSFPQVSRDDLLNKTDVSSSDISTPHQVDSDVHGTDEDMTSKPDDGKSADDSSEVTQPEQHADLKTEEQENPSNDNKVEDSNEVADRPPASGDNEKLSLLNEDDTDAPRIMTDSSTSDSSFEKVTLSETNIIQSSVYDSDDIDFMQSHKEGGSDASHEQAPVVTTGSTDNSICQDDDYVKVDSMVQSESHLATMDASSDLEQSGVNVLQNDGANKDTDSTVQKEKESVSEETENITNASLSISPPIPKSSSGGSALDNTDALSFETMEKCSAGKLSPDNGPDESENISPASSLVMLDRNDIEDLDVKDDDSAGIGSFKMDTSSHGDKDFIEEEDIDEGSHDKVFIEEKDTDEDLHDPDNQRVQFLGEEEIPHLDFSDQPLSAQKRPVSVKVLPALTYSDQSSLSSNSGDESKKDQFADAMQSFDPQPLQLGVTHSLTLHAPPQDQDEPSTSQTLSSEAHDFRLSAHAAQSLQSESHSGSELASSFVHMPSSSPTASGLQGLGALRMHPDVKRSTESDSGDMEFTTEDIQEALALDSRESSDEQSGPQPPQTNTGKVPVKIESTEKFVFFEEDNEDIDV